MRTPTYPVPPPLPDSVANPLADLVIKVVTPMFGGGVNAGENDPDHLIRASSIRGHLRFWWRACNAASYEDDTPGTPDAKTAAQKLYEDEEALWGSASKAGNTSSGQGAIGIRTWSIDKGTQLTVATELVDTRNGQRPRPVWRNPNGGKEEPGPQGTKYAYFASEQSLKPNEHHEAARKDVLFRVRFILTRDVTGESTSLGAPLEQACIEGLKQALATWILLGGIGARTRRGCGALFCQGDTNDVTATIRASEFQCNNPTAPEKWIKSLLDSQVSTGKGTLAVPRLTGRVVLVNNTSKPGSHPSAWATAIKPLSDFTQGGGIGRMPKRHANDRLHQSYWPEIGAVRNLFNLRPNGHYVMSAGDATGNEFPRSDLGLPRQIRDGNRRSDPLAIVERNVDDATRMASPVILKPVAISATTSVPIAVLLNSSMLWETKGNNIKVSMEDKPDKLLRLESIHNPLTTGTGTPPSPPVTPRPKWPPTGSPVQPPNVKTVGPPRSARVAFMDYLEDEGWTKIK